METSIQQYKQAVSVIKDAILYSQYRAAKLVTGEQLSLYFGIGGYVSAHSRQEAWGTSVIDRISEHYVVNFLVFVDSLRRIFVICVLSTNIGCNI